MGMSAEPFSYDLILVNVTFREVNQYLNIVNALSGEMRIGVFDIPAPMLPENLRKTKGKVLGTDELSTKLLCELGAEVLDPGGSYACRLCLVPQSMHWGGEWHLPIVFDRACSLERFGSGAVGTDRLRAMGVEEHWVFDRVLYDAINQGAGYNDSYLPAVEMGTPYARYPAIDFSHLELDYIVAEPTPMLLDSAQARWGLRRDMAQLVSQLGGERRIAYKGHNARPGSGQKTCLERVYSLAAAVVPSSLAAGLGRLAGGGTSERLLNLAATALKRRMRESCLDLDVLTPYAGLGLEHFLPFVGKGVITGISSCIWHALYNNVPVYNCDVRPTPEGQHNEYIYRAFHVPPCGGEARFDSANFAKISASAREADVMELIKERAA